MLIALASPPISPPAPLFCPSLPSSPDSCPATDSAGPPPCASRVQDIQVAPKDGRGRERAGSGGCGGAARPIRPLYSSRVHAACSDRQQQSAEPGCLQLGLVPARRGLAGSSSGGAVDAPWPARRGRGSSSRGSKARCDSLHCYDLVCCIECTCLVFHSPLAYHTVICSRVYCVSC